MSPRIGAEVSGIERNSIWNIRLPALPSSNPFTSRLRMLNISIDNWQGCCLYLEKTLCYLPLPFSPGDNWFAFELVPKSRNQEFFRHFTVRETPCRPMVIGLCVSNSSFLSVSGYSESISYPRSPFRMRGSTGEFIYGWIAISDVSDSPAIGTMKCTVIIWSYWSFTQPYNPSS
jgi:hypothetical protein